MSVFFNLFRRRIARGEGPGQPLSAAVFAALPLVSQLHVNVYQTKTCNGKRGLFDRFARNSIPARATARTARDVVPPNILHKQNPTDGLCNALPQRNPNALQ
jgi:hypothetical protein